MDHTFGRYTLLERLAVGGMGEVLLARVGNEPPVVVKRVLPHLADDAGFKDLFLGEVRIAAQLHHKNVVRILELGEVNGAWFVAMDYVEGRDLRRALEAAKKTAPLEVSCRIIADAAAALAYAHSAKDAKGRALGVVHCDVSPHNLLVGFDGVTRLIDFGVARAARQVGVAEEALRGKFPYLSPEQATEKPLDPRSDQFSLGVVFWELLTGKRLFQAGNDALTLQRVLECEVPPPSSVAKVPKRLEALVLRMLRKEADQRFAGCDEVLRELEEAVLDLELEANATAVAVWLRKLFPGEQAERTPTARGGALKPPSPFDEDEITERAQVQLSAAERLALAQLSVSEAPLSLETIEVVVDLSTIADAPWVVDVVQTLTEAGLLHAEDEGGERHFVLTPWARELGASHLAKLDGSVAAAARTRLASTAVGPK